MVLTLPDAALGELVTIGDGLGIVRAIGDAAAIDVLRPGEGDVRCTGRFASVPVGDALIGRVLDPLGAALDGRGAIAGELRLLDARPPGVRDHAPIAGRLRTGIKAVDVCAPAVRGAVIAACGPDLRDVLATLIAAHGPRTIVAALGEVPAAADATIVTTPTGAPAAMRALAPKAALAIAEDVRARGGDALVVIDDLDQHAEALGAITAAERFSIQAALFARAGRRAPERGGGSITIIAARAAPPSPRPSPLDALFAMDSAWTFAPHPGVLARLAIPRGLSKYAPPGTAPALVPHSAGLRLRAARGDVRLLDQRPGPVALTTLVALSVAAWGRVLDDLAADEVLDFERALATYLADERPDVLAAIDPAKRLTDELMTALVDAAREVSARLAGN